jgi:hypothetical protein
VIDSYKDWPELEDIFTLVDLSANTGHHLGPDHSASDLRTVRRSIIVRMIRMLNRKYIRNRDKRDAGSLALQKFFTQFDTSTSAVLSMNWDTVFEQGIERTQKIHNFEYGCRAQAVEFLKSGEVIPRSMSSEALTVIKPHGSINWLYCDACRDTFWSPPEQAEYVAQTLFQRKDWEAIGASGSRAPRALAPNCPRCAAKSLGTRFATFSYRKALDFPMHAASWQAAEELLRNTSQWIFVGYSMPAADFEFKHLLKRVQLSKQKRPKITVITGGEGATETVDRFKKFFGDVAGERTFLEEGLDVEAIKHLTRIGALKSPPVGASARRPGARGRRRP